MTNVTKRINLDVYSSDFAEIVRAQQGDTKTRTIEIALYNQNEAYTISSGVTAKVEGQRGDNSLFSKECTYSGNVVTLLLDDDILLYAGTVKAKVVLYAQNNKEILSSTAFRIAVDESPCDTNAEYEQKANLYNDLRSRVATMEGILSGKMHICGMRAVTVSQADVAADTTVTLTKTFSDISKATTYLIIPTTFSYCTPQDTSVSKNVLTATLHNVTNSTQNLTATFYVVGCA